MRHAALAHSSRHPLRRWRHRLCCRHLHAAHPHRAGIAHCTQAQAAELMACVEGARAAHHAYSVDVLVPNRRETLEAFPEIPCDRATIDDYLRLMLKGASK